MPRLKLKKPHITVRLLRNKIFLYITSLQPPGIFTRNQRLMPLASCKWRYREQLGYCLNNIFCSVHLINLILLYCIYARK